MGPKDKGDYMFYYQWGLNAYIYWLVIIGGLWVDSENKKLLGLIFKIIELLANLATIIQLIITILHN